MNAVKALKCGCLPGAPRAGGCPLHGAPEPVQAVRPARWSCADRPTAPALVKLVDKAQAAGWAWGWAGGEAGGVRVEAVRLEKPGRLALVQVYRRPAPDARWAHSLSRQGGPDGVLMARELVGLLR